MMEKVQKNEQMNWTVTGNNKKCGTVHTTLSFVKSHSTLNLFMCNLFNEIYCSATETLPENLSFNVVHKEQMCNVNYLSYTLIFTDAPPTRAVFPPVTRTPKRQSDLPPLSPPALSVEVTTTMRPVSPKTRQTLYQDSSHHV